MAIYKTYLDFLQDRKFLEWKIIGSDESNSYWLDFKANNPQLIPHLEEAEAFLRNYKLDSEELSERQRSELLQKHNFIQFEIEQKEAAFYCFCRQRCCRNFYCYRFFLVSNNTHVV